VENDRYATLVQPPDEAAEFYPCDTCHGFRAKGHPCQLCLTKITNLGAENTILRMKVADLEVREAKLKNDEAQERHRRLDMMDEEDRNKLVQEIWAKSTEEIEKAVKYAIIHELRGDIQSRARKVADAEIDKILRPMIEARREELIKAAEKIAEKMFQQMEDKVLSRLEQDLQYHSEGVFAKFAETLVNGMKSAALGEVTRALKESHIARQRAYLDKKAAQNSGV